MSRLLVPRPAGPDARGRLVTVTRQSAAWRYVGFEAVRLRAGERCERETGDQEVCVVILAGRCDIACAGERWRDVGGRRSVFDGPPHAAYVPPANALVIEAKSTRAEIALGWAPATRGARPQLIQPGDTRIEQRGSGSMARTIHHILMEERPAEALLVTEVLTPAGHWSSYPPHKHDTNDPPRETYLEETYYHRLRRPEGFALHRVYTPDRALDETIAVRDGDLVLVPKGYHTVSAAPGYDLYYLNVMAGPVRQWKVTFDPDHRWLLT